MAGPLVFGRATVTVVAVDRRRSRRTALDFAQAIGVLSRQRVALEKIAKRLAAGGFSEAARSVTDVGHRLTELAAAVNVEAEAAGGATAARRGRPSAMSSGGNDFFARAYSVGPCPDCKAGAGSPCRVFRPPRGAKSDRSNIGSVTGWPHRGRIAMARDTGAFDGFQRST